MINEKPEAIRDSVEAILQKIDNSLSGYNRNSLLSAFNAGMPTAPDSLFLDIYERAYGFYEETDGVLDVASAPLFDIWGFGFKSGEMPDDTKVKNTLASSGMKRLVRDIRTAVQDGTLSGEELLAIKDEVNPKLNYNAIAQGYSCDVVARYLYSLGVKDMMVDIGEIFCDGRNPSGKPWTIGIDKPVDGNNTLGADLQGIFRIPSGAYGVVTSGNYRKYYIKDGKKYAHTIDPRTGYPVTHNLLSATILAPDATSADAYATYCMVVGLEDAMAFISSREDLEGCLVYDENGEFRTWTSSGFILE
jgi:thiamine biosynthesis lipoprotein